MGKNTYTMGVVTSIRVCMMGEGVSNVSHFGAYVLIKCPLGAQNCDQVGLVRSKK